VSRLFALDQNFPQPIVEALAQYIFEAELVPIAEIDERLATLDDWEVMLTLHHHERPWDGLITTDANMLVLTRELAVLMQTKLTLYAANKFDSKEFELDPLAYDAQVPDRRLSQLARLRLPEPAPSMRSRVASASEGSRRRYRGGEARSCRSARQSSRPSDSCHEHEPEPGSVAAARR
jgi:hypothetical protein